MELEFVKVNPAGNITVIVLDRLPRHVYAGIAQKIMASRSLGAEQVGFMERARDPSAMARLHMMGGEFCGNASRAFGAWLVSRGYPGVSWQGDEAEVPVEVSGYAGLLSIRVRCGQRGRPVWASSPMPAPDRISFVPFRGRDIAFVEFPGISHAVVWDESPSLDVFREVAETCGAIDLPAFGVMFVKKGDAEFTPLVRVKDSGSLVWEGSCASGSIAVAGALTAREGRSLGNLELRQPGGMLQVRVDWDGRVIAAEAAGPVQIVAHGTVWV